MNTVSTGHIRLLAEKLHWTYHNSCSVNWELLALIGLRYLRGEKRIDVQTLDLDSYANDLLKLNDTGFISIQDGMIKITNKSADLINGYRRMASSATLPDQGQGLPHSSGS